MTRLVPLLTSTGGRCVEGTGGLRQPAPGLAVGPAHRLQFASHPHTERSCGEPCSQGHGALPLTLPCRHWPF